MTATALPPRQDVEVVHVGRPAAVRIGRRSLAAMILASAVEHARKEVRRTLIRHVVAEMLQTGL